MALEFVQLLLSALIHTASNLYPLSHRILTKLPWLRSAIFSAGYIGPEICHSPGERQERGLRNIVYLCIFVSRAADSGGSGWVLSGSTFEKRPYPTFKKKPALDSSFENKPYSNLTFDKGKNWSGSDLREQTDPDPTPEKTGSGSYLIFT